MVNDHKAVQRQTAQYDLFNRLHSIAGDEAFVRGIAAHYDGRFEVVANQRCGTWYCDPQASSSSSAYAYFKSTDGHHGTWGFSMRRSNLPLASLIQEKGGVILVDSTRRGKRMPDALSKTVPIWCAVINRAIALRGKAGDDWDEQLHLPPSVPPSERAQIEARLSDWAKTLETSSLPLPDLQKPLRPFWIHPSTRTPPTIPLPIDAAYIPIICVSASKWVGSEDDVPSVTRVGSGRTQGFSYVQGAGDDDELWSRGLTADMFYQHKAGLLEQDRDDMAQLVDRLVDEHQATKLTSAMNDLDINGASRERFTGAPDASSRLALALGPPIGSSSGWKHGQSGAHQIRVALIDKRREAPFIFRYNAHTTLFACPNPRFEPHAYGMALDELVEHVEDLLDDEDVPAVAFVPGDEAEVSAWRVVKEDETRVDLADVHPTAERMLDFRKTLLPLAVVLLLSVPELGGIEHETVGKKEVADTLHRLVAMWPDGNPPRAALKRVNEYLMSPR